MKSIGGIFLAAFLLALGSAGCAHHDEAYAEPVPVGYAYEPGYYDHGYYRNNDWYWRDRDGHLYHEGRDEHEGRMRDFNARSDGHAEHHEGEHDLR